MKWESILSSEADIEDEYENKEAIELLREIVSELPPRENKIIMMYFGFINDRIYTQREIAKEVGLDHSMVSRIINRILKDIKPQLETKRISKAKNVSSKPKEERKNAINKVEKESIVVDKKKEKKMKKLRTVYEYFSENTKEEVDIMLSKLTKEESELARLRWGDDLLHPETSDEWNREHSEKFYGTLIPKMRRLLANPTNEKRRRKKILKTSEIQPVEKNASTSVENKETCEVQVVELEKVNECKSDNTIKKRRIYEIF